jgi:predicted ATPase
VTEFAQAIAAYTTQGNKFHVPFFQGLLAEMDDCAKGADGALTRVDEALALAAETGECWSDAFLHRIRGHILLKGDPANIGPAEQAFLTAIAVAQQQRAKSFELRAAVSLAKLYQSAGRAADAHAIVVPALEGFSQTLEFPEIAEAQAPRMMLQSIEAATSEIGTPWKPRDVRAKFGHAPRYRTLAFQEPKFELHRLHGFTAACWRASSRCFGRV